MAYYLKGIGDRINGTNEILPQFDARILHFLTGGQNGIIISELNSFAYTSIDRGIRIRSGFLQAWGYFAMNDTDAQFNFVMPSSQAQFAQVYAEIDLSKVPQLFEIKCTNPSNSNSFTAQQDNLRTNPYGKYQQWLYTVQLNSNNTIAVTDRRVYISKPLNAVNADYSVTQAQSDNSTRVATTAYVRQSISDVKNITTDVIRTENGVQVGTVRRQVNFVLVSMTGTSGIIPDGFRPKSNISAGARCSLTGLMQSTWPGQANITGSVDCYITTDGKITVSGGASGMWGGSSGGYGATLVQISGVSVNAGYEITE